MTNGDGYAIQNAAVKDALRITAVVNKHLAETNCIHSIRQIMSEVFEFQLDDAVKILFGGSVVVSESHQTTGQRTTPGVSWNVKEE